MLWKVEGSYGMWVVRAPTGDEAIAIAIGGKSSRHPVFNARQLGAEGATFTAEKLEDKGLDEIIDYTWG